MSGFITEELITGIPKWTPNFLEWEQFDKSPKMRIYNTPHLPDIRVERFIYMSISKYVLKSNEDNCIYQTHDSGVMMLRVKQEKIRKALGTLGDDIEMLKEKIKEFNKKYNYK